MVQIFVHSIADRGNTFQSEESCLSRNRRKNIVTAEDMDDRGLVPGHNTGVCLFPLLYNGSGILPVCCPFSDRDKVAGTYS